MASALAAMNAAYIHSQHNNNTHLTPNSMTRVKSQEPGMPRASSSMSTRRERTTSANSSPTTPIPIVDKTKELLELEKKIEAKV